MESLKKEYKEIKDKIQQDNNNYFQLISNFLRLLNRAKHSQDHNLKNKILNQINFTQQ